MPLANSSVIYSGILLGALALLLNSSTIITSFWLIFNETIIGEKYKTFLICFTFLTTILFTFGTPEIIRQFIGSISSASGIFIYNLLKTQTTDKITDSNFVLLFIMSCVGVFSYMILGIIAHKSEANRKNIVLTAKNWLYYLFVDFLSLGMNFIVAEMIYTVAKNEKL
jgi:hypothetical protein